MMNKVLVVFLVFICALSAFSSGQKEMAAGPVTLAFWTHEDPNRTKIEERYMQEFQAANPNITVQRVTQPSKNIKDVILTAFAANEGPDIFNMEIENEYAYIVNGRVAPVDAQAFGYTSQTALKDAYSKGVLDPVTEGGKIYGLPLELTNWCVYINNRVFKSAGLDATKSYPKTWEEMADVSDKLAIREGQIIKRRGFDFRYPYYLTSMVPMVEQLGGDLVSADRKTAIISDAAWIKFLTFMKDWGPNGRNLGSPTYPNARSLFNKDNNDVAMCMSGLYQEGRIRNDNPKFYESMDWMVVPFPQFKNAAREVASNYYGHYYMVNSQKPENARKAAWQFIAYMLKHSEEYLTTVGLIQPTKALMASKTFKDIPYTDVFAGDMEKGHVVYFAENSAKMQDLIREAVESVMLAGVDPQKALATLKTKAQEIMGQ